MQAFMNIHFILFLYGKRPLDNKNTEESTEIFTYLKVKNMCKYKS